MNNINERIRWIDYSKAIACFLVALGHLLMSLNENIDPYTNVTSFVIWFIYLFHMPLFMCMSGILYFRKKESFHGKNTRTLESKSS